MLLNDELIVNLLPVNYRSKLSFIRGLWNKGKSFFIKPYFKQGKSLPLEICKEYNRFRPSGPHKQVCYVPFVNLSFSQNGIILSCNYNQHVVLGKYPGQSIREAWESMSLKKLQQAHSVNDLSMGCDYCNNFFITKKFSGLKPLVYDEYAGKKKKNYPAVMEFELSNTCNLECIMCNGSASSMIQKKRENLPPSENPYNDAFVEQLKEFIPHLEEAKFYGGEPFLIEIYYKIWNAISEINPGIKIFIITNGTVLNDQIKDLLNKGNFELAVSMDSVNKINFERIRKNADYEKVRENTNWFNNYCKSRNKQLSISVTLSRENWKDVPEIVEYCNKINARVFFSYLQKPAKLALWNLSPDVLRNISIELTAYKIKPEDSISKYNLSCFNDFKKHLEYWREKNSDPNVQTIDNYKKYFNGSLIQYYSSVPCPEEAAIEIITRLDELFKQTCIEIDEEKIYSELVKIPLETILFHLKENPENLKTQAKQWAQTFE